MAEGGQYVANKQDSTCCDMRKKVGLGVAKVFSEDECGVPDSAMVDFHNFDYKSTSGLPVEVALTIKFCPWCGTPRSNTENRRTIEVINSE